MMKREVSWSRMENIDHESRISIRQRQRHLVDFRLAAVVSLSSCSPNGAPTVWRHWHLSSVPIISPLASTGCPITRTVSPPVRSASCSPLLLCLIRWTERSRALDD